LRARAAALAGLLVAAAGAQAQEQGSGGALRPSRSPAMTSSQFMGSFSSAVTLIPDRETLEAEVKDARLRLGPLKLRPVLNIGNLGYTDNFFGTESADGDFTATVEGGVKAIVPAGGRLFVRGSVLPAYTWYSTNSDRSAFGGTYDAALYYYLPHFAFQATAGSYSATVNLSSEVEQPVKQDVLAGQLRAQYELGARTALVGDLNLARRRYGGAGLSDEDLATLSRLDGSDAVWSLGVRRKVGARLLLGVSYEQGDLTSVSEGELRDATSRGVLGSAYLAKSRLEVNVYLGYRDFRPKAGSSFVPYDGPSGGGTVSYALTRLVTVGAFARSNLVPSLYSDNAVYDERRAGVSLAVSPRVASISFAYETGQNRYAAPSLQPDGSSATRRDDVRTFRGGIRGSVGRALTIGVTATQEDYTSNLPGFDRKVFTLATTVGFGASGRIDILK